MPAERSPLSSAASDIGGAAVGGVLAVVAAARRGKAVHPHGVVHRARLVVEGTRAAPQAAELLATPGEHQALVRFSRSLGLPRPLPDLLGMSIRVVDAYGPDLHQDLLLVTSVDLPVLHHVFVPARGVDQRPYSSAIPYRAGEETFLIGAVPRSREEFALAVAPVSGRFATVARIHIGERLDDELDALRFNPFNTGGGMEPVGVLNGMRARAYPMSQAAWGAAQSGGAAAQQAAERALRTAFRESRLVRDRSAAESAETGHEASDP